jgi:hypothetical protein
MAQFKAVALPTGQHAFIPSDLHIIIPNPSRVSPEDRHYLAYMPWETKYYALVPEQHRPFFKFVLPFLHARTSNVHTALSIAQLPHILPKNLAKSEIRRIYLALILHDTGWSQVNQQGLLTSLNYNGVKPSSPESIKPKQQHLVYGEALAYQLLDSFDFGYKPLSSLDIYTISEMIRRHDHDAAWEQGKYGPIGTDIKVVCDADRLWSYTRENFWLDTIRKDVPPETYLQTIAEEIETYFFTSNGKQRARALVAKRLPEVQAYAELLQDAEIRSSLILKARNPSRRILYKAQQLFLSAKSRRVQRSLIKQNAY